MAELDELLARFGAGDHTWELGARLAAVLAKDGRTAQVPGILVQCKPLQLEQLGAERVVSFDSPRLAFTGWRLPAALGRSAILDLGSSAHEVRLGDRFVTEPGPRTAGFALVRSMGESVASLSADLDTQSSAGTLRESLESALNEFANAIGATVEHA